jgi:hypothetical protein
LLSLNLKLDSEYTARAAETPGLSQNDVNSQLLVSLNGLTAAANMHLNSVEWNGLSNATTTNQYLAWVKGYVLTGYPVVMGIYVNQYQPSSYSHLSYLRNKF